MRSSSPRTSAPDRERRRARLPVVARISALSVFLGVPVTAAPGVDALRRVVDDACRCAAGQPNGLTAAMRCTDGPEAFGRLKVGHRDGWDASERAAVAELERVIERCIAGALDAGAARERLGLPPLRADGTPALVRWKPVAATDLGRYPTHLVRVRVDGGAPLKGLVDSLDAGTLVLRRARRDGGGRERIPLDTIDAAWVMQLPDR